MPVCNHFGYYANLSGAHFVRMVNFCGQRCPVNFGGSLWDPTFPPQNWWAPIKLVLSQESFRQAKKMAHS